MERGRSGHSQNRKRGSLTERSSDPSLLTFAADRPTPYVEAVGTLNPPNTIAPRIPPITTNLSAFASEVACTRATPSSMTGTY